MHYPASFGTEATYDPNGFIRHGFPTKDKKGTLLSGQAALLAGTMLGQVLLGAATHAAKAGGNAATTGDLTLDATTPVLAFAQPGIYLVRCITAASNGGTFRVTDPKGNVLGDVAVGATFANQVKFTIADGAQDFIVGEGFDITIAAGSKKYKKAVRTAVDGSQYPKAVLLYDADAGAGDVGCMARHKGGFNLEHIIHDVSYTDAQVEEELELNSGIVVESIAAGA